ncbi:DUF2490 domain-containing protein [Crocinitomicaceae bacterium]|nr:DUF2490 domain-containing protein [Crocinitomicaceae bacterium]
MTRWFHLLALTIGLLLPIGVLCQNDFELWTGTDLRYKVSKELNCGLKLESRFKSNITEVDQTFLSPYLQYKPSDHIRLGLDYRMANRPSSGFLGKQFTHRITMDLIFRDLTKDINALKRFNFDTRIRFTHATRNEGELNNNNLRFRIKVDYNLRKTKLTPHFAASIFYHFNDQIIYTKNEVQTLHRFNKYRLRIGANYPIHKKHVVGLFYMIQPEINGSKTTYVLSLGYSYRIKK